MDLRPLDDASLLARLEALARQERESVADVVDHLREVDRRELALDRGYRSLFDYCVRTLKYSEAGAFLRIRAARASSRFPEVLEDLRSGRVSLDSIARLYPHLNEENRKRLLERAAGASKREVLALVADLSGGPAPSRDVIRPLPTPAGPVETRAVDGAKAASERPPASPEGVSVVVPPRLLRFQFTADDELVVMTERLRALLRHRFPEGRLEQLFKHAVSALLDRIDPERAQSCPSRRAAKSRSGKSRWIPEAVKKAVRERDGHRCAYVSEDGRRCESAEALEFDHIVPFALGGRSDDASNIRLLCRPHNQRLARRRFGPRRSAALPAIDVSPDGG